MKEPSEDLNDVFKKKLIENGQLQMAAFKEVPFLLAKAKVVSCLRQ